MYNTRVTKNKFYKEELVMSVTKVHSRDVMDIAKEINTRAKKELRIYSKYWDFF